ncbi:6,7-dimethyl-8-ribityllumazine synthase [Quillaja saponaria]|uniref:6,7-dimethyl-8-ribityllumazine synthase n=1 Tax=Quillaja saponaria TaxID=32244 RepID=A0AAD7LKM3_QUISA|nr:6,7-dimethyl-8-ribityllumazine synthase [Quillaja saponaria]
MGNSLRCCLACVLPCGALDLIRIVHLNGQVEEITQPITAGEVLKANPNHVLSKPSSQGVVRRILILSPESELKRGSIYFLIPTSSLPEKKKSNNGGAKNHKLNSSSPKTKKDDHSLSSSEYCDSYLKDHIQISQKKSSRRRNRRTSSRSSGQIATWQPHLESISED